MQVSDKRANIFLHLSNFLKVLAKHLFKQTVCGFLAGHFQRNHPKVTKPPHLARIQNSMLFTPLRSSGPKAPDSKFLAHMAYSGGYGGNYGGSSFGK